jgi:polyketide cyclase/dehydrase/lipid transport protein
LDAPADAVFPVLASFAWADRVSDIETATCSPQLGSTFTTTTRWLGRSFEIVMLVDGWDEPSWLSVSSVGAKQISFRGKYQVSPVGNRTEVVMQVTIQLSRLLRPLAGFAELAAIRRLEASAARLAELVGCHPTQPPRYCTRRTR